MDCASAKRLYDPLIDHKNHFRVGVQALVTLEVANASYGAVFADYLTATAGTRFDPPLTFEAVPLYEADIYNAIEAADIDFLFVNSGLYSCIGIEYGIQGLATVTTDVKGSVMSVVPNMRHLIVSFPVTLNSHRLFSFLLTAVRGYEYQLDVYGGVIFTRIDNSKINTIYDLKDKIIAAGGLSVLAAGQSQMYEMVLAGLSYVLDPKMMVFVSNQDSIVKGVMNKEFDVGFVRTVQIERTVLDNGQLVDPKLFKVRKEIV
jgi:hypothetical protein